MNFLNFQLAKIENISVQQKGILQNSIYLNNSKYKKNIKIEGKQWEIDAKCCLELEMDKRQLMIISLFAAFNFPQAIRTKSINIFPKF